jgi:hypothetical protein
MSWGPAAWARNMAPSRQGASLIDHHEDIFLGERRYVIPVQLFIELRTQARDPEVMKLLIMLQSLRL